MPRISQCFILWNTDFGDSCVFIAVVLTTFSIFCIFDALACVASLSGERLSLPGLVNA